jgi:hypothetical protein
MSGPTWGNSLSGCRSQPEPHLIEHFQLVFFVLGRFLGSPTQGTADNAQHLHGFQGLFRHKDALILKGRVRRNHAVTTGLGLQKIVGNQPFECVPITESELDPKSGRLGTGRERSISLPGFGVLEIPNETNGFSLRVGNLDQGPLWGKQFQRVRLEPTGGLDEPLQGFPVEPGD